MNKKLLKTISFASLSAIVIAAGVAFAFQNGKQEIQKLKASSYSTVLNNGNSPTLVAGEGTMVDSKKVTWEYSGAQDFASGHVSLQHEGYMGIASISSWGVLVLNLLLSIIPLQQVNYGCSNQSMEILGMKAKY